jgi:hypothetical protein
MVIGEKVRRALAILVLVVAGGCGGGDRGPITPQPSPATSTPATTADGGTGPDRGSTDITAGDGSDRRQPSTTTPDTIREDSDP